MGETHTHHLNDRSFDPLTAVPPGPGAGVSTTDPDARPSSSRWPSARGLEVHEAERRGRQNRVLHRPRHFPRPAPPSVLDMDSALARHRRASRCCSGLRGRDARGAGASSLTAKDSVEDRLTGP